MVGETGLEPAQDFSHNDLNVARIPIPPLAHVFKVITHMNIYAYRRIIPSFAFVYNDYGGSTRSRLHPSSLNSSHSLSDLVPEAGLETALPI